MKINERWLPFKLFHYQLEKISCLKNHPEFPHLTKKIYREVRDMFLWPGSF